MSEVGREELIRLAVQSHNALYGRDHCDPKYIMSCNKMPNLVMQAGAQMRERATG